MIVVVVDTNLVLVHFCVESTVADIGANPIEVRFIIKANIRNPGPFSELTNLLNCASGNNFLDSLWPIWFSIVDPCSVDRVFLSVPQVAVFVAVFARCTENVISCSTILVDWVSLQAVRQSIGTELRLPLGEISILDWWHGVALLPRSQVILVVGGV